MHIAAWLSCALLCALLITTGSAAAQQATTPASILASAATASPAPAAPDAALTNLFLLDPVAHGAWLYNDFCYRCHGAYADVRLGESNAPARVLDLMRNGTVDMAAMGEAAGGPLSDAEIVALAAYIFAWEAHGGPPSLPAAVADAMTARWPERTAGAGLDVVIPGNAARGATLFTQHCAVCHGAGGEGGVGAPLAKAWTVDWPDLTVRTTIAHGTPRSAMIAWSQARGGPLTAPEIEDLTAFVLTLAPAASTTGIETDVALAATVTPTPTGTPSPIATSTATATPTASLTNRPTTAVATEPRASSAPPMSRLIGAGLALALLAGAGLALAQRR